MCPACIATAALIAGTTTGTGGLTALVVRKFRAKSAKIVTEQNSSKESHDGKQPDKATTT
jgi:hypothetical protein